MCGKLQGKEHSTYGCHLCLCLLGGVYAYAPDDTEFIVLVGLNKHSTALQ